jgi:flavin-dependent dehydrogenase
LVIGAGPAGAVAARALARSGARVLLCERGSLPRQRLCGEFVSPEAVADLAAIGLDLAAQGAISIRRARFVVTGGLVAETPLDPCGYGLSRHVLDAWLAASAVAAGAELRLETPVVAVEGSAASGFIAQLAGSGEARVAARFVIAATGKSRATYRRSGTAARRTAGWIAFETHVPHAPVAENGIALYGIPGGYVGLAPVEGGRTNVCMVARPGAMPEGRDTGAAGALAAFVDTVPALSGWWPEVAAEAAPLCSESGARFGAAEPVWHDVLQAGDAACLPHPVGGDGIAMAIRGGRLAAWTVRAALDGRVAPERLTAIYAAAWQREFRARLRWCARLHAVLERPWAARALLGTLAGWPAGMRFVVARTRGASRFEDPTRQEVHA